MEEEFISLIQSHEGIIYKVIRLYVDGEEERKDLYQEILLQTWKSFKNFRKDSAFSTWLYRVSLNTALTFRKKEDYRSNISEQIENEETVQDDSKSEDYELLYLLIKQLNEIDRMIITLHLDAYKNQEIAGITGMKINHINVKIHRIKATIIDQFKKRNDGHI